MNGLSLFSGAGIGELALKQIIPNYRTVGYVEWDKYCQDVIRARIKDEVKDDAPIFGDIREFNTRFAGLYAGKVDFISGGFPCQPFSFAGKRQGEADERNMWPATVECIGIIRPRYAFLENVPGLFATEYIWRIIADLSEIGYDCEWLPLSAAEVGAPHKREREWILAYDANAGLERPNAKRSVSPDRLHRELPGMDHWKKRAGESAFLGRNDAVANRVDRLKAIGNGWVPQVVRELLKVLY